MKKWTLESPGAGLLLHLVFFTLVLATVHYSERQAAPAEATPRVATAPIPTHSHPAAPGTPVADALAERHPLP